MFKLSYLFVIVIISLYSQPTHSQFRDVLNVSTISEVIMGDGVSHQLGSKCQGSFMGGFYATILLNGAISSPQEQATIVFTSTTDSTKVKEIPYLSTENPYLSGSGTSKITFVVPHIKDIEPNYKIKTNQYKYNISVKIKNQGTAVCAATNACQINYHFGRTPLIWQIFNSVSIPGMYHTQRVQLQYANDVKKQSVPFRHIAMHGFKCDYSSNELITDQSSFSRWTTRPYSCVQEFFQPVLENAAQLQTRTYSGDGYILPYSYTYLYDGGYFSTRVLPSISSVSAHSGSKDGGSLLTVKGKGWLLQTGKTALKVDGSINCNIKSLVKDQSTGEFTATCETEATTATSGSVFIGGQGWKHQIYKGFDTISSVKGADPAKVPDIKTLIFNSQILFNNVQVSGDYVSISRTFFKAPKSGNYYIWHSGDDGLKVYFSKTPSTIPATWDDSTDRVVNQTYHTGLRSIWSSWDPSNRKFSRRSERIDNLVKDNYYYMELYHSEGGGEDHATIGFQIQNSTVNSLRKLPEVQRIEFRSQPNLDEYKVKLYWGSDHSEAKKFDIKFYNKNSDDQWENKTIADIAINSTTSQFKGKVEGYFDKYFKDGKNNFVVVKTMYSNEAGTTTTTVEDDALIVEFKIHMKVATDKPRQQLDKLPELKSSNINLSKSEITFTAGEPGLSGEWQLEITSPSGEVIQTGASISDLKADSSSWTVTYAIWNAVPEYYYKVFVVRKELKNSDPQQSTAGYEYIISYDQYRANVPEIKALNVDMKYGENGAKTPTFSQETIQSFSDDLFFFPAPYEFFYTPHTKPQMQVNVDSHLGACQWSSDTTCDFEFVDEVAEVTNIASTSPFTSLTITGTTLGSSANDYQRIEWAGRTCTATVTDTQISCTITNPVAGSHLPVVNSKTKGKVKQTGLTAIDVPPTLTSVSPNNINDQGGQVITLTGTRFPDSTSVGTHTSTITVGGVSCSNIQLVSATSMKCTTGPSIPTGSQDVVLTINGQSVTSSGAVTVAGLGSTSATITPTKMNATEKGTLTVTISNLAEDLSDKTKFDVKLVSAGHTIKMRTFQQSYTIGQNVLQVKYPGGKVGDYVLVVDHADKGTLSDGSQNFRVGAKITAISVKQGSLNGGTEITITGELFHLTQSIIKVGYNDCIVQGSITTTSVTCITPRTSTVDNVTGDLKDSKADVAIVVNLTEDAKCQVSPDCLFDWKETLTPKVTLTAWSGNTLTITGQGFGSIKSNVKVELQELEQQVDTVSDTSVVVTVNNLKTRGSKLKLRIQVSGKGYALIPTAHYQHDAPGSITYTALTPATGVSQGGQTLTITGTGFASDIVAQLKDKDSTAKVCDSVKYVSFTELKCQSNAASMNFSGTTLVIGSSNKTCNSCSIATTGSSPILTSIADGGYSGNDQTLTLTGTDFPTGGETIVAVKISDTISSSSATINSATSISAVFTGGIGFGTGIKVQSIEFSNGSFAKIDAGATIDQNVSGTATSNLNCSYAGGCLWSYDQANINRLASSMSVSVCNLPCVHDSTKSTDNSFKCRAPVMATKKSIQTYTNLIASKSWQNFNQKDQTEIVSVYSNDPATFGKEAFDNNVSNQTGTSQASCYLGLKIVDVNHVGTIDSVRYFFPRTLNADKYVGGKFEVSNDGGTTWSDLFTIEKTPMEGWNGWDRVTGQATAGAADTFNVVKYTPPTADSSECNFMEIDIKGKVVRSDSTAKVDCPVVLKRGAQTLATQAIGIIYNEANTPTITSLSQTNISANGGQSVTITGTGFSGSVTVSIDGIQCTSPSAGGTTVSCTTGKRAAYSVKPFIVQVGTNGYAANQGNKFLYVLNWSDPDAWSGEYGPVDGDSISIPAGQNLVFDIDKGPLLKALIVEGSLLFYPDSDKNHKRTFDAEYVFVRGGLMQIGTESAPYDSYLTITMHGTKKSAEIPIYGNKVIAVRDGGVLEMHGEAKTPSWTDLYTTADVGATTMELNIDNTSGNAFNWQVGDVMVLAPTDFDFREAEEITITSVTSQNGNNRPEINFTPALKYKHYAGKQTFSDGSFIEMRAELGVLTRKVVFQGDSQSQDNQYGAHIMLHSPGDEAVEGRIENIQLTQVGQAFQLGRYPLHFHMIGRVTKSYIKNNAIHHTYNRACTLHGVHYLTIQGNVAYYTMGHTFFIEDAAETKNRLIRNLAIRSEASNSLLNTDQSPASFWITHPDNIFRDNHAAGAARYGFWFDMQKTAIGPSFDANVCPPGQRLGQFNGNVAHSNGRYGLRIFHFHIPRTHPCKPVSISPPENSANPEDDAFAQNPPIVAVYENYTGYKNNRNAVITEKIGAVQFKNIKTADNLFAGIETTIPGFAKQDQGFLDGALIIGFSQNAGDVTRYTRAKGIIAGQKDTYIFKNVKFHNFDGNGSNNANAAIGTCSHCAQVLDGDAIANTSSYQGLTFNAVTKKLIFSSHRDAILHDIDGSLSGTGAERWITPSQPHHQIAGVCSQDSDLDTASVCSTPVRKLIFKNGVKSNELKGQKMKIALAANVPTIPQGQDDVTWTADLHSKFSQISQNHKKTNHWEIPFVIGQKYNVHWQYGIDWEGFTVKRSKLFKATDPGFALQFNYTDRRDQFHVKGRAKVDNITTENAVLDYATASNVATQQFGAHINNIPNKLWSVLINSKPDDGGLGGDSSITVTTTRCTGGCTTFAKINVQDTLRYWSKASDWQESTDPPGTGKVPVAGDQVVVKGHWNMVYDIQSANAVNLKKLFINGRLTFASDASKHYELKSQWIILQSGQLIIGEEETQYPAKATITLLGTRNQQAYAYSNDVIAGNKIIFVTGKFFVNGGDNIEGGNTHTKLLAQGTKGQTALKVDSGLKWKAGHKIAIAPSGYDYKQHELKEIQTYDDATGDLTLTTALQYDHFGAANSDTYQTYTYDLRTEVGHLTKNVIIQGEENERWGGQLFVTEFKNSTSQVIYAGTATLKNVEFIRMSQYDTQSAALRTSKLQQRPLIVDRCSFHQTPAWAFNIGKSNNITITNNVIYQTHRNAIKVHGTDTFKMTNNLFIFNQVREFDNLKLKDHQVAVDLCTGQNSNTCKNMLVQNNVVAGGKGIGWLIPSMNCDDQAGSEEWFKNNKVHSVEVGMIPALNNAVSGSCGMLKNFQAHHNYLIAITSYFSFTKLLLKNIVLVDNSIGLKVGIGSNTQAEIVFQNSLVIGEHNASRDCTVSFESSGTRKIGMMSSVGVAIHSVPFKYPKLGFFMLGLNPGRGKQTTIKNVVFKDFPDPSTRCKANAQTSILHIHQQGSDLLMPHIFRNVKFDGVAKKGFVFLMDPPQKWANPTDCVDFPCTAPQNFLLQFRDGVTDTSNALGLLQVPFDIIGNNPGINNSLGTCSFISDWNSNICQGDTRALLQFESLDSDTMDRSVVPLNIINASIPNYNNKLNSFMDHVWDGFYTGQKRLSRFIAVVRTDTTDLTEITFTGTPPLSQLFQLYAAKSKTEYLKIKIDYPKPEAVRVKLGSVEIGQQELQNGVPAQLTGTNCGENRWTPQQNILEFTLLADPKTCSLTLITKQSIQVTFRIEMTIAQFYNNNHSVTFVNRLSASLGIATHRIRVVGVTAGSVVVHSEITQDDTNASESGQISEINQVSQRLNSVASTGTALGNWNVLDFSMEVRTHEGGKVTEQATTPTPTQQSDGLSIGIIVLIVIGCVVFVTVIVLVIMILLHRRKPKVLFSTTAGGKGEIVDDVLFQKTMNPLHTQDVTPDDRRVGDSRVGDNSYGDIERNQSVQVEDIDS